MTKEEFKSLDTDDKFYIYLSSFGLTEYTVVEREKNSFRCISNVEDALYSKIYYTANEEYFLTKDLAIIDYIKQYKANKSGSIRKYISKIRKIEEDVKKMMLKLNYDDLLEKYPEEFI